RVLEIGCGTGLLLFRIAPHCESYCGTDFSQAALDHVRRTLVSHPAAPKVTLLEREAIDFSGLGGGDFDLVILNSVVQYFPGQDYLLEVLAGSALALNDSGAIFVGDVRDRNHLRAFHASLAIRQAPASLSLPELDRQIRRRIWREEELTLSPEFFST